jgi:hypothetical protein
MTGLPGFRTAARFGVSRTLGFAEALAKATLPRDSEREAFRARATDAITDGWEFALDALLRARLIERTADRLLSEGVVERVVTLTVEHPATAQLMTRVVESPRFEQATDRLLSEGLVERVVAIAIEHPATEGILARVIESPGFERLVLRVVHSELFDQLLDRVLASEQLDRVVAQIAESDEVHDALREQSQGMADEVTDELRSRTIAADAFLERVARSLTRRGPRRQSGTTGPDSL